MKNLMEQILKFGVVGFVCFLIDFGITTGFTNFFGVHYLISKFLGFVISAVVNYILSIKFVFTKKKEMDKKKEFTVFIILSAFGLLINEVVMYVCMDGIYVNNGFLQEAVTREMMVSLSSIVATGIVMVYNFISRKLFLERK
ncbi:MAG: GtrA family protein [Lachnospiraceae bacterium]|jgi:putative flippase GtrA|nr:GtrA family protein [Lachnospiraceae bacterium]MDE6815317.1 GtrA family protein [Lachnospiraceae bacterium]